MREKWAYALWHRDGSTWKERRQHDFDLDTLSGLISRLATWPVPSIEWVSIVGRSHGSWRNTGCHFLEISAPYLQAPTLEALYSANFWNAFRNFNPNKVGLPCGLITVLLSKEISSWQRSIIEQVNFLLKFLEKVSKKNSFFFIQQNSPILQKFLLSLSCIFCLANLLPMRLFFPFLSHICLRISFWFSGSKG